MNIHRINDPNDPLLPGFWTIYLESFPELEQRTLEDHTKALEHKDFYCIALAEGQSVQGIICYWDFANLRYVEHFALSPEMRNGGVGSRFLADFCIQNPDKLLMLEIDPLVDEISRRRLGFYERLGFVLNEEVYIHPPYQKGHTGYSLLLMSLGRAMTREERTLFEDSVNTIAMQYAYPQCRAEPLKHTQKLGRQPTPPVGDTVIAEIRRLTGWNRHKLAEKMGVKLSTVKRWETCQRKITGAALTLAERILKEEQEKRG